MGSKSLLRWEFWRKGLQRSLTARSNKSVLQASTQENNNACHRYHHCGPSNIVNSPFEDIDIPNLLIPEYLWGTVDRFPEATGLKCGITGRSYKYSEIKRLSQRFMNSLIKGGFSEGDVIGVVLPNCPEFAIIVLGALEADLAVSFFNHVYTADEICHQLKDSGCVCIVSGVNQLQVVQEAVIKLEKITQSKPIKRIIAVDIPPPPSLPTGISRFSEMIADHVEHSRYNSYKNKPNNLAFLPYSSGTTGLPKGVCLSHRNIVSNICQFSVSGVTFNSPDEGQDVILGLLPFYHIYGLVCVLLNSLVIGGQTVILPKFEQESFINTFEKEKLSVLYLVPPLVLFLGSHSSIKTKHLDNVRYIVSGAAPLGETDMERLHRKLPSQSSCTICQAYGMSELSPVATVPKTPIKNLATVGVPVPNTQAKVIDPDTGNALPPNHTGELCFRGPQVMMGYHNNPKATADMIDPEGWLKTGDIGYYDEDLHFYIEDRLKELIKVKGLQVAPAELEALLRNHPNVNDVGVIGVPDERAGELPVAYIVPAKDKKVTEDEIKEYLSDKVAKHKQISKVIFTDVIPKSAAGKILRKELRQKFKNSQ